MRKKIANGWPVQDQREPLYHFPRILIYAPDSSLRTGAHRPKNSLFHFLIPLSTFCHLPLTYVSISFAITTYKSPSYRRKKKSPSDDQAQFRGTTILSFPTSPPHLGFAAVAAAASAGSAAAAHPPLPPFSSSSSPLYPFWVGRSPNLGLVVFGQAPARLDHRAPKEGEGGKEGLDFFFFLVLRPPPSPDSLLRSGVSSLLFPKDFDGPHSHLSKKDDAHAPLDHSLGSHCLN